MATTQSLIQQARDYASSIMRGDLDAICAYWVTEPIFDLYPVARRFSGMTKVRRHFHYYLTEARARIRSFELRSEWVSEAGLAHEVDVKVLMPNAETLSTHRVFRIITFGPLALSGERIYADQKMLRFLIGPLWNSLDPIPAD